MKYPTDIFQKKWLIILIIVTAIHAVTIFYSPSFKEEQITKKESSVVHITFKKVQVNKPKQPKKRIKKKRKPKPSPKIEPKPILEEKIIEEEIKEIVEEEIIEEQTEEVYENIAENTNEINNEIKQDSIDAIKENYLYKLRQKINNSKSYPKMARRMNQEGTVLMNFLINNEGKIVNLKVEKSSRYKSLNKAAKSAIKKVGTFEPIPKELKLTQWEIIIPVVFSIK